MNITVPSSNDVFTEFQKNLLISPFHSWLGLNVVSVSRELIEISLPWRKEFVSNTAIQATHGGILAALIDLTGLYAVRAAGGNANATADLRVDYHRPATPATIVACGTVVKLGRRLSTADVRISNSSGILLASGRGAYLER